MKRKRHRTDEVIWKLREAEALEAQGQTIAQVCQKLEVSEPAAAGCTAGGSSSGGWGTSRSSGSRSWRKRTAG